MRLNDMAPASTINNSANVSALQSEIAGYGLGRFAILGTLTYLANKIIGHGRGIMSFAFHRAVTQYDSWEMRPAYSVNDMQNIGSRAAEGIRERLLRFPIGSALANLDDHIICKLRPVMIGSLALTVFLLVSDIRLLGIPSQVFNAIIASIAIVVTSLHSWRARTDKGGKNKAMDRLVVHLPVSTNNYDKEATVLVVYPSAQLKPCIASASMSTSLKTGKQRAIGSGAVVRIPRNWFAVVRERWCVHGYYSITHGPMVQI